MGKKFNLMLLALVLLIGNSCRSIDVPSGTQECIKTKIRKIVKKPVERPPAEIRRYQFNGKTVYCFPPKCCNQFSELYDDKCNLICQPDARYTGGDVGTCPQDFFKNRMGERIVWKDNR